MVNISFKIFLIEKMSFFVKDLYYNNLFNNSFYLQIIILIIFIYLFLQLINYG